MEEVICHIRDVNLDSATCLRRAARPTGRASNVGALSVVEAGDAEGIALGRGEAVDAGTDTGRVGEVGACHR